jgi:MOSC domain-containing protein YiiM
MSPGPAVVALHLCRAHAAPVQPVAAVSALLDAGLDGDLHARPGSRRQVLFVDLEILETLGLAPGTIREQVTVRGLGVQHLPEGTAVRIGTARFEVGRECDPCELMDGIRPGLRRELEGRRGRFLRVTGAGSFAVGDAIAVD